MSYNPHVCFIEATTLGRKSGAAIATTKRWIVNTACARIALGEVKWFYRWRCYAFFPTADCVFERRCLRDIAAFCEDRTATLRASWPERKRLNPRLEGSTSPIVRLREEKS